MELSQETENRVTDAARRQGVSVEELLERLLGSALELGVSTSPDRGASELPVWRLGSRGSLRRADIYTDIYDTDIYDTDIYDDVP